MRAVMFLVVAIEACGGCVGGPREPLTLVTFNAANGADDDKYRTAEMRQQQAAFLAGLAPDILALQETDHGTARVGGADTAAAIAPPGGTLLHGHEQEHLEDGWYGMALWVSGRHRVLSWEVRRLPNDGSEVYPPYPPAERAAMIAHIRTADGREITVVSSHLTAYGSHPAALRALQFEMIAGLAPDVVMGDMNASVAESRSFLSPPMTSTTGEAVDQVWTVEPSEGRLVATNGVSDHTFAAVAVLP